MSKSDARLRECLNIDGIQEILGNCLRILLVKLGRLGILQEGAVVLFGDLSLWHAISGVHKDLIDHNELKLLFIGGLEVCLTVFSSINKKLAIFPFLWVEIRHIEVSYDLVIHLEGAA